MPVDRWWRYLASPDDDCAGALLEAARAATRSLHAIIYSFTLVAMADALHEAHRRGLEVGVVADQSQSEGVAERPVLQRLVDAGVPLTITTSRFGRITHDKILLIDQSLGALSNHSRVAWGSFNWSGHINDPTTGAQGQDNVLELSNDPSLCDFLWARYRALEAFGRGHCPQMAPAPPPGEAP